MDIVFYLRTSDGQNKWIIKRNDKIIVLLKRTEKNVIKQLENTINCFTNFFMIDQTMNDERTKWFVRAQSLVRNITISAFTVIAESWPDLAVTT